MSRKTLPYVTPLICVIALGFGAAVARGDGLPVPFDGDPNASIRSLEGGVSYSAVAVGGQTAVLKIGAGTGDILRSAQIRGTWAIPLVAYDGSPSGLSPDGRVLTVIEPRRTFPRPTTDLAVLDANTLELRERLALDGDFSFDALSPDGRTIYLIEYTDPRDPTAYEVRAYDVERGRLLPDPIVDPNEEGEDMAGFPQTRAVSPDGRWAYTLYAVPDRHHPPFIHALDTQGATAVCIDLDVLADHNRLERLSLSPSEDGSTLAITERGDAVATVDLETYEVAEVTAPSQSPPSSTAGDGGSAIAWVLIGGGLALTLGAGLLLVRRRARPVGEAELERLVGIENGAEPDGAGKERERDPVA